MQCRSDLVAIQAVEKIGTGNYKVGEKRKRGEGGYAILELSRHGERTALYMLACTSSYVNECSLSIHYSEAENLHPPKAFSLLTFYPYHHPVACVSCTSTLVV